MTSWQQARGRAAALCGAWIVCSVALVLTIPLGRPVNDDYWAIGSLMHDGFGSSLSWYYTEFQGNVVSWFFILLHEVPWLSGVPADSVDGVDIDDGIDVNNTFARRITSTRGCSTSEMKYLMLNSSSMIATSMRNGIRDAHSKPGTQIV